MITENAFQFIVKMHIKPILKALNNRLPLYISKQYVNKKNKPLLTTALVLGMSLMTMGCDSQNKQPQDNASNDLQATATTSDMAKAFEGCYTISHNEPAQIKISIDTDKFVMQMKEPASAKRIWDNPEPLEILTKNDVPNYFSIDADKVDAIIARPDKLMILAKVKSSYANLDPLLDSEYLAYIYRGANTIYQVACDDTNMEIVNAPKANVKPL